MIRCAIKQLPSVTFILLYSERIEELGRTTVGWPPQAIAALTAPTLLIIGDSDIVRPEHVVAMFRLLGGGVVGDLAGLPRSQLAVLPGTTHVTLVDRTAWLTSMITPFLDMPLGDDRRDVRTRGNG